MWFSFVAKGLEDVDNKVWWYLSIRRLNVDKSSNDLRGVKKPFPPVCHMKPCFGTW